MAMSLVVDHIFVEFLQIIYPYVAQFLPACRNTVYTYILEHFTIRKQQMKEFLVKSSSKISFSFDLWTSLNHLTLLGILAHFVDKHSQTQSVRHPCLFLP